MTAAPALTLDGFHTEFATFAEAMAADRARAYPAKVAAGEFSQAEANHRIFVMRGIAEIWRCATDNSVPQPLFLKLTRPEALDALARAIDLAEARLRRIPPDKGYYRRYQLQADRLRAMYWWHSHFGEKAYVLNMAFMLRYEALQRAAQARRDQAAA